MHSISAVIQHVGLRRKVGNTHCSTNQENARRIGHSSAILL